MRWLASSLRAWFAKSLSGDAIAPYYTYSHFYHVVPGDNCPVGGSSVTGGTFYPASGGNYPAKKETTASQTRSTHSWGMPECSGSDTISGDAASVTDRSPRRQPP